MIYRGPGFLARRMIWVLPHPLPLSPVSKLSLFLSLPVCRMSSLLTGEGGGEEEVNPHKVCALPLILHY
jgi:hypothetical protein